MATVRDRSEKTKQNLIKAGVKSIHPYQVLSVQRMYGKTFATIQNLSTKEKLVRRADHLLSGTDPWVEHGGSDQKTILEINKIGSKSNPPYKALAIVGRTKSRRRIVKIQNLLTNQTSAKSASSLYEGNNPWRITSLPKEEVERQINAIGGKASPAYKYVSHKRENGRTLIKIQNLVTKSMAYSEMSNLKRGRNPWNEDQDRHEERIVHPKVKKFLQGLNYKVDQEVIISKRSRVDFICTNKDGRKILIEVKSDKKEHSSNSISTQLNKYRTDGKKKFGNSYAKTYLVSLEGTYGFSLNELKRILRQDGLI